MQFETDTVRQPKRKQLAQSEDGTELAETTTKLKEGVMVAVYLPQYRDETYHQKGRGC